MSSRTASTALSLAATTRPSAFLVDTSSCVHTSTPRPTIIRPNSMSLQGGGHGILSPVYGLAVDRVVSFGLRFGMRRAPTHLPPPLVHAII